MSEEENERDFMKACFNAVEGLEVKNESQAIPKEVILDEVENLTKENKQLKEVIEEVKRVLRCNNIEVLKYYDEPSETGSYEIVTVDLLQILDKVKGEMNNE